MKVTRRIESSLVPICDIRAGEGFLFEEALYIALDDLPDCSHGGVPILHPETGEVYFLSSETEVEPVPVEITYTRRVP